MKKTAKKVSKKTTKPSAKPKVYWYASTENVLWMGPYDSQEEAWAATIGLNKLPVKGAMVWCSKVKLKDGDGEPIRRDRPSENWWGSIR